MDDLYDNLENYNDVNIVDELKSENRELKLKLEEISRAMAVLQKDFDKVSSEYKKLEINYSSLLKTARAEIERKTEALRILNHEKDMIVINTMKDTGKNVLKVKKGNLNPKGKANRNNKTTDSVVNKEMQNKIGAPENDNKIDNRVDSSYTPSIDTVSIASTGMKSTSSEEKATKPAELCEKVKNKENFSKTSLKDENIQYNKHIRNRSKSMSRMSHHEPKFSSDEDAEAKHLGTRKSPLRSNLKQYERHDTRIDRDIRIEPHENYDSSIEYSRLTRSSRYTNYERSRNVDRPEIYPKHRRQYSPERDQHRYTNEYEDFHVRGDYGTQRAPRTNSPSTDKYNRSKSRDRRFNYDRDNYREYEKQSNRHHWHSALKHKTRNEFDEPSCKRQKTDIYGKGEETNIYMNNKEREISERLHAVKPQEYRENSSCQSPDYVNVDSSGSQHFVKEIMNTAATKLEDPRISSKKYVFKVSNDSTTLSTVLGRDIDIHWVDKSRWGNLEKLDVPTALTEPIVDRENDNLLKEIYMDIEDPPLLNSLESGEIDNLNLNDNQATINLKEIARDYDSETDLKSKSNVSETRKLNVSNEKECNTKVPEKSLSTKFKIPKIKKPDKMDNEKDVVQQESCDINKKSISDLVVSDESIIQNIKHVSDKQNNKNNKSKNDMKVNSDSDKTIIDKRTQDIIRTIEGDLELSDEASDIMEFHNDTNKRSNDNPRESKTTLNIDKELNPPILKENKPDPNLKSEPISNKIKETEKSLSKKGLTKDSSKESSKKRKSKRKTIEQKETNAIMLEKEQENEKSHKTKKLKEKDIKESISQSLSTAENKPLPEFAKAPSPPPSASSQDPPPSSGHHIKQTVSKQTMSKFSDLFGDSSSLITPDDLGINNIEVKSVDKYTSIFDNTEDAVDLSVEDIANTLTSINKVDAFDTNMDKPDDEKLADKSTSHFSINVTVVNDGVNRENGEHRAEDKNSHLNVYENTKSETLTDAPNIVKTIIISSGVQPECLSERCTLVDTPKIIAPLSATITNDATLKKCPLNSIKALATSTPQKYIEDVISPTLRDSLCTNTNTSNGNINASSNVSTYSNLSNTDELQKEEADIPDVRIFVRRRRKPVRKAT